MDINFDENMQYHGLPFTHNTPPWKLICRRVLGDCGVPIKYTSMVVNCAGWQAKAAHIWS